MKTQRKLMPNKQMKMKQRMRKKRNRKIMKLQ